MVGSSDGPRKTGFSILGRSDRAEDDDDRCVLLIAHLRASLDPAIVDSFEMLGQNAAGTGPLDPGGVVTRGLNLAGSLIDGASTSGIFTNFGGSLALVVAAVMCLLAFCLITIQFVMTMVESYILVAAAFIFLGFGGSRWSQS